tara:strand:+ start:34191 stop:34439 length:249 start_codon:yes stop_codon:yes gene_type:complete
MVNQKRKRNPKIKTNIRNQNRMKIKNTLKTWLLYFVFATSNASPSYAVSFQSKKSNVTLSFIDDMGYGERGCYGHIIGARHY